MSHPVLPPERVQELLTRSGAYLEGHFELRSGRHSDRYVEKFRLLERPDIAAELCAAMADAFRRRGIQRVVGPALGGVIIAYEVARSLGVPCAFAERVGDDLVFRRGFTFKPAERVLVVEDIVSTGASARRVVEAVRDAGAEPVAAAVLVNRSGKPLDLGTEAIALLDLHIPTFAAADCPLCRKGIPLQKPGGKGAEKR